MLNFATYIKTDFISSSQWGNTLLFSFSVSLFRSLSPHRHPFCTHVMFPPQSTLTNTTATLSVTFLNRGTGRGVPTHTLLSCATLWHFLYVMLQSWPFYLWIAAELNIVDLFFIIWLWNVCSPFSFCFSSTKLLLNCLGLGYILHGFFGYEMSLSIKLFPGLRLYFSMLKDTATKT